MPGDTHPSSSPPPLGVPARAIAGHPELADTLQLVAGEGGLDRTVTHPRVQKSGLVLVGHSQGVVPSRVQVLGETEISYLEGLEPALARERIEFFCGLELSMVVVTRGVEPPAALLETARRTDTPLVVAPARSSTTINALHAVLDRLLAPAAHIHGVLVEVHGIGTLLTGPSGIGKSECALFLVERGHRLVADDIVHLTRVPNRGVKGAPAPLLRHHLEIRGLGILNIRDLYGATSVRDEADVRLIAELCHWQDDEPYERLGLDERTTELLGVRVSTLRIPVRPGRDMGVILEMAARNHLLKQEGHHSAQAFADRLEAHLGFEKATK